MVIELDYVTAQPWEHPSQSESKHEPIHEPKKSSILAQKRSSFFAPKGAFSDFHVFLIEINSITSIQSLLCDQVFQL